MPPPVCTPDLRPFDIENCSVRVASTVGNLHSKLGHARPFGSRIIMPPPSRGAEALSGDRRPSSVCLSVCLMSRTSALTRTPKGLGRRNFAQGYPRSHATRTPTSRSKGQKSRSQGGGILWRSPGTYSRTACSLCTRWTDRQTNGQKQRLLPLLYGRGHNKQQQLIQDSKAAEYYAQLQ